MRSGGGGDSLHAKGLSYILSGAFSCAINSLEGRCCGWRGGLGALYDAAGRGYGGGAAGEPLSDVGGCGGNG